MNCRTTRTLASYVLLFAPLMSSACGDGGSIGSADDPTDTTEPATADTSGGRGGRDTDDIDDTSDPGGPTEVEPDVSTASETLDVVTWNVEWLGDTTKGPSDEALQLSNVRDVIDGTDFEIWALQEVVSNASFNLLESQLPGYIGFAANDPLVVGGAGSYTSEQQKPAILYKSAVAVLVSARVILTENDFDFAGRPPLEVTLDVTLNGVTERRIFIILHMKSSSEVDSWRRRTRASAALKRYLDTTYPTQKVLVLGDFNDDLDTSIAVGRASPYANFVTSSRYEFPSLSLTTSNDNTTCDFPEAIDHQLASNELFADYVSASVEKFELDTQLPSYCDTTSDHFPVLASYRFSSGLEEACDGSTDDDCQCAHSECSQGVALTNDCSSCVSEICAVDAFCCDNSWDAQCVSQVASICGSWQCSSCAHSPCVTGVPLVSTCDSGVSGCVGAICAADAFCCNNSWDAVCAGQVLSVCGIAC